MTSFIRSPLVHFWFIGLILFVVEHIFFAPEPVFDVAYPSNDQISALASQWQQASGREASVADLAKMIQQEIDQSILLSEALRLNFHYQDSIVRQRLIRDMRFMQDDSAASDVELLDQAYAMELHTNDLVVRRRLVQMMENYLRASGENQPLSDEDLKKLYRQQIGAYTRQERLSFTHAFVSQDQHGALSLEKAEHLLAEFNDNGFSPESAVSQGDPFISGHRFSKVTQLQIAREFGAEFAEQVFACSVAQWCGPIRSVYGWHGVWLGERLAAEPMNFESVRAKIAYEFRSQSGDRDLEIAMAVLRVKYQITGAPK
ncbi:MAG: parvulin-like peptidyl-prolyl isomerase [Candidatus Azotimanducaceae bacterium]|jgi:parvulin-like peptidyl-prolyl isomerase